MFKDYKDSVFKDKTKLRSQLRFKSDLHIVCTEEVNKIAISNNDDKRLQAFDGVATHPYGKNIYKVCKSEMMALKKYEQIKNACTNSMDKSYNNKSR